MDVFCVVDEPAQAARIILDFQKSNGRGGLAEPYGIKKPPSKQ